MDLVRCPACGALVVRPGLTAAIERFYGPRNDLMAAITPPRVAWCHHDQLVHRDEPDAPAAGPSPSRAGASDL